MSEPPQQRFVYKHEITPEQSWRLLEWCISRGATELTLCLPSTHPPSTAYAVMAAMERFRLADSERDTGSYAGDVRPSIVPLWRLTAEVVELLAGLFDEGLFTYPAGDWPGGLGEDPIAYRGGQLMLWVVSHEGEAVIRLAPDDLESFAALGLRTHPRSRYV